MNRDTSKFGQDAGAGYRVTMNCPNSAAEQRFLRCQIGDIQFGSLQTNIAGDFGIQAPVQNGTSRLSSLDRIRCPTSHQHAFDLRH